MTGTVHIVDYGIGNLYSVARAVEKVGGLPYLTSDPDEIVRADRVLLPGVGAFRDGMAGLRQAGVADAIVSFAASGRPLLGICLGMQMLATDSSEYGIHAGLDIIPGRVEMIAPAGIDGHRRKIPFVGWAGLKSVRDDGFAGTLLDGVTEDDAVYLVHSFEFRTNDPINSIATYDYDGLPVTAAISHENVTGFQFHPEKSAHVGLRLIEQFVTR